MDGRHPNGTAWLLVFILATLAAAVLSAGVEAVIELVAP
jgi:hypothetical protein